MEPERCYESDTAAALEQERRYGCDPAGDDKKTSFLDITWIDQYNHYTACKRCTLIYVNGVSNHDRYKNSLQSQQ